MLDIPQTYSKGKLPHESYFTHNPDVMFHTELQPVFKATGFDEHSQTTQYDRASDWVTPVRTDTGESFGMFKEGKYTLVQNHYFFKGVEYELLNYFSHNDLENMKIKDHVSYGGAEVCREYIFKTQSFTVETDIHSTDVVFRVIAMNCFNGSKTVKIIVGNIDMFCTNGLILGEYSMESARRTSGFDLSNFIAKTDKALGRHIEQGKTFNQYARTKVLIKDVTEFFERLGGASDRLQKQLEEQFMEEASIRGMNMWSVISTLSNYSSHTDGRFSTRNTGSDHSSSTLLTRQNQVAKWLSSDAFSDLTTRSFAYDPV